jgi:glycosyltransferase involved in cell wall biosynthesis
VRVAIVHDWLIGGGAEKVVEQLHKLYPDAPIYTSYCTPEWRKRLDYKVVTGPLQAWPFSRLRKFIPFLRIWWFTSLKLDQFDLVISSTGAEAKGIKTSSEALHISYIHAPSHYYWSRYDTYVQSPGFGIFDPLARFGLKLLVGPLRKWDLHAAQRPDFMIANSTHTQSEIKKYYGRKSTVIHPPVDINRFSKASTGKQTRKGFVIVGRQVPYKRIDLAVKACSELNLPLTVIGNGPDHSKLARTAGPSITFIDKASNEELAEVIWASEAFLFPGVDDFGIAPVEALASGTPVIAYQAGGALDYIIPGKTGEFFTEQTVDSLKEALQKFDNSKYNSLEIQKFSDRFSEENFKSKFSEFATSHKQEMPEA